MTAPTPGTGTEQHKELLADLDAFAHLHGAVGDKDGKEFHAKIAATIRQLQRDLDAANEKLWFDKGSGVTWQRKYYEFIDLANWLQTSVEEVERERDEAESRCQQAGQALARLEHAATTVSSKYATIGAEWGDLRKAVLDARGTLNSAPLSPAAPDGT